MTAACIPFEQIEDRAETSLAWAIWARRASQTAFATIAGNILLAILAASLKNLDGSLTTEALEQLPPDRLRDISVKLKELLLRLTSLCSAIESSTAGKIFVSSLVNDVCETTKNLESVSENIQFALRPEFKSAMESAIDRLRLGAEHSVSTTSAMSN